MMTVQKMKEKLLEINDFFEDFNVIDDNDPDWAVKEIELTEDKKLIITFKELKRE